VKGFIDRFLALNFLIVMAPVLALISAAIAIESGGPIIFRQRRFGVGNVPFSIWKFRTMAAARCDPSGANQTSDNDPRVTRVGRFLRRTSLDELPQLFNVLRGEMSLIGPRAHPCGMTVEGQLCEAISSDYHLRHAVRPGITGWAQVNGSRGAVKSAEMLEERVSLDLYYIANWSLLLDMKILFKTVEVVFSGRQAR
jgi:lipopolysaccharide/colanic/teichoic acid biosynthesis glycosyltransferase